jgi:hypothetical protein
VVDLDQIADGEQGHGMNIKQKSYGRNDV